MQNDTAAPSSTTPADTASPPAAEMAGRFVDALQSLEAEGEPVLERMVGLFSEDASVDTPALREAGLQRIGADGVRTFWREYLAALGSARTSFGATTLGHRSVGLFWTTRKDGSDREPVFAYEGATLLDLDEAGRVARFHAYFSPRELDDKRMPA